MATVSQLIELFLSDCAENKSPATVLHYKKRLKPFLKRFEACLFAELLPIEVKTYINDINKFQPPHRKAGQLKAAATRASNAVVLQLLQAFARELRVIDHDILPKLEVPVGSRREDLPTNAEVKKILARAQPAFALIYRALRQTGARPNELVRATFADWHRDQGEIVLETHKTAEKTGTKRRITVGKRFAKILEAATEGRTEGPLFLNCSGQPWTVASVSKHFSRLRDETNVRKSIVLYCTRHEHATKLVKAVGLDAAADALNHSNINTTRRYDHKKQRDRQNNQDLMTDPEDLDDTAAAA